jgi:hypothetical protein
LDHFGHSVVIDLIAEPGHVFFDFGKAVEHWAEA